MKKILRLAVLLISLLPSLSLAQQPAIVNGGFAAGLDPWWREGNGIRVQNVDGRRAALIPSGMVVQENIRVTGGRRYRLSMDVRTQAARSRSVYVQISFRGQGVDTTWRGPALVGIDDRSSRQCSRPPAEALRQERAALVVAGDEAGWQPQSVVVTAPANADRMVLYLRKANCSPGVAAFSNVSLTETDEPSTAPADTARAALAALRLPAPDDPARNAARLQEQLSQPSPANSMHGLASGGVLAMRVHVGPATDLMTLQAAADLSDFLAKAANAEPARTLSTDLAVSDQPLIAVGRDNAVAARAFSDDEFEGLGEDGFLIRSLGPHIVIAGATPRGTMYGVNWFLDRKIGIRWLSPEVTYWPGTSEISLPRLAERQVPRFAFREVLSVEGENKAWRQRNLMNGQSHGPSFLPSPVAIDSWNDSWAAKGAIFNFFELLPQAKYAARYPNWYAGGQLAMMDEDMRDEMARVVIRKMKALPDYRKVWFAIHDMDWGWDMDPASKAFAARHGGRPSAPRLDMMIGVAERVRKVLPEARFAFNAYHWSFTPPEGMTVPDYMLVYPMTIHVNYRDALNGPANAALGRDIEGWNRIAKHVLVWDHITNFAGFIQPTPNIKPIGDSIRWLATLDNVQGYMGEGSFNTRGAEFAALRAWMIARLLWNPSEDVDALIDEFCDKYYGPAGPAIAAYIRFYHDRIARTDDVLAEKTTVDMAMFDAEFVRVANSLFERAEKAAQGTEYLERVRAARLPLDYVILLRRFEYGAQAGQIGFDVNATLKQRSDRFWRAIETAGVSQYMQGDKIDGLRRLMDVERHVPEAPSIAEGTTWKDIQDISFQRFAGGLSAIVSDRLASDGAAIALDRRSTGWNTQLKFDKLPKSGQWWLYASVRYEAADEGEAVARLGSAPPMSCFVTLRAGGDIAQGYRWVAIPGGPFAYDDDHARSIYVQPIAGKQGQRILIDRIVALDKPAAAAPLGKVEGNCD